MKIAELKKTITRKTCRPAEGIRRRLVVSLEPGDILAIRELGRQKVYRASLAKIAWMMIKWEIYK